ncbi:MAG: S8 family serine peptidase [Tenuifilaceae bacterium]
MRNSFTQLFKLFLLALVLVGFGILNSYSQEYKSGVLQGTIRIKVKPTIASAIKIGKLSDKGIITTGIKSLDNLNITYSVTEMKRVFPYSPKSEEKLKKHGLDQWYELSVNSKFDSKTIVNQYSKLPEVSIAEPIHEKKLIEPGTPVKVETSNVNSGKSEPFNDPYLPRQWHYNNTGQTGYVAGADINLYEAWQVTTGSSKVIVSVHDQGVQYNHEDLENNMWVNDAELKGKPGIDDDGNGYTDDIYGFNFADNMGSITSGYHGTHVAGTIAATNNNGKGVAGIAGGNGTLPGARIMSCQILGGVSTGNLPDSYVYAANNGAVISQNSWGYNNPDVVEQVVLDAIDYFIDEAGDYDGSPMHGGVVIFAAGNDNYEGNWYPACYKNVIAVSALDASNFKASYSNYGTWVDIAAPGGDVDDNLEDYFSNGVLSTLDDNGYGYLDGTSMACPHVSGIAALIVSKFGSDNFTSEALKSHLLTGAYNIDTISGNTDYAGKLGVGNTDAILALQENEGIAPNKINNLLVKSIAQDFIVIEWTIPTDEDDNHPYNFQILYSKESINAGTLEFAKSKVIRSGAIVGDTISFDVEGLDALTKYYFSVRSIDRWGNISDFSNEASGTTNEGPNAWVDKSEFDYELVYIGYNPITYESYYDTIYYLPVNVDTQINTSANNEFYLHNSGNGLLRWNTDKRHISSVDAFSKTWQRYPQLIGTNSEQKANIKAFVSPQNNIQQYAQESNYEYMEYYHPYSNFYYIGETDLSYPNSSATRFYVDSVGGFNLTNIQILLNYKSSKKAPVIFEVYTGESINTAKLIYVQELTETNTSWNSFELNEQIHLKQGTYFWLVTHIPAGNLYPLGAGIETKQEFSKNCYMSLNFGKSWARFEDLYYNNMLVWAITPVSLFKTPGEYFSLTPNSGEVSTSDSIKIEASIDATKLINGTYKANVVINTNEIGESMLRVPVNFQVTGQKPVIKGEKLIDFGSTILGTEKLYTITVNNAGYGKFKYPSINISNPDFELIGSLNTINPQSEYSFKIKYKPTTLGNSNAVVTLSDTDGNEYKFNIFAIAAAPPVMELSIDSLLVDNITIGDTISGEFYLKNIGNYPLTYYFPTFAAGEEVSAGGDIHKFGYSAKHNEGGALSTPEFKWTDISTTGTSITDYNRENRYWYYPVELGFEFPFYGKTETQVYITNYGLLSFDMTSVFNSGIYYKGRYNPERMICAMGMHLDIAVGGAVYYQDFGDVFIVQYDKVIYYSFDWVTYESIEKELTFQIVLHDDGNINMYYKDLDGADPYDLAYSTYIGIEDRNTDDAIFVTDPNNHKTFLGNNTAVEFMNPGLGLLYELSNSEGIINVSDSVHIEFKAKTDILNMGMHIEKVPILSNDPFNNPGIFSVYMNVIAGGKSDLQVVDSTIDFGNVFQTDIVTRNLWLVNKGKASDTLSSATLTNGYFDVTGNGTAIITPNRKQLFKIAAQSDVLGTFNDTLTVISLSGDTIEIGLTATIIEAPKIDIDITSIADTLEAGTTKTYSLKITNNGGNNLEVAPIGNHWINIAKKATKTLDLPEYTYFWQSNNEVGGPTYSWKEIKTSGTKLHLDGFGYMDLPYFSEAINLPFSFNFYGADYNKIYIGYNGLITLNEPDGSSYTFGADSPFPAEMSPNNLISPMWGFIYPYEMLYEDAGVYYQIENDHIIIEWSNYGDAFYMAEAISFQAIIYSNGNIKYQYNYQNGSNALLPGWSGIGVENADGTNGVTISYRQEGLIKDQTAILLSPVRKYTIEPSLLTEFEVTLNTKVLFAGDYSTNLKLLNNTPDKGSLAIPIDLNVTGSANLAYENLFDFGKIQVIKDADAQPWEPQFVQYIKEFEIANNGVAKVNFNQFDYSKVLNTTIEAYVLGTDFLGNPTWVWENIQNLPYFDWNTYEAIPINVAPKSSLKFRAILMPQDSAIISDTLLISNNYADSTDLKIVFTANAILPPSVNISNDEIHVYTNSKDDVKNHTFYVDNTEGASALDYTLEILIKRDEVAKKSTKSGISDNTIAPALIAKTLNASLSKSVDKTKYNRVLQHDNSTASEQSVGYGGSMMFASATRFTAPNDGFNLTHVQTWYVANDWLNSDIEVEIYAGDAMIENAQLVYTERFNHTITQSNSAGELITFQLTKNQIFYPKEDFFIVFKYPTGVMYPQGMGSVTEQPQGRFMFGDGNAWYELAGQGFNNLGWMVRAVENEVKSSLWVELLSSLSGSINASDSSSVELKFTAANANSGINYAELFIKSNDPYNSSKKVPVYLHKNLGPQFDIENIILSVNENDTLNFQVTANDIEGDSLTLKIVSLPSFVTSLIDYDNVAFNCTPSFDNSGIYSITIEATDKYGNKNNATVILTVNNTNRSPKVINQITDRGISSNEMPSLNLLNIISDPDGDVLTYSVVSSNENVVKIFMASDAVVFTTLSAGTTTITITGTDPAGLSVSHSFNMSVWLTGVENLLTNSIKVYPNPTSGDIYLILPQNVENGSTIRITNIIGTVLLEKKVDFNSSQIKLDVSGFTNGIYFVKVIGSGFEKTIKVVKN